jgi:lipopolysaccharide biosynthesis glycosyltransferase
MIISGRGNVNCSTQRLVDAGGSSLGDDDRRADSKRVSWTLVMACDEAYAMPLATALRSIADANRSGWPLQIHVLSHDFAENIQRKVVESLPKDSVAIRWVAVDLSPFEKFAIDRHVSRMTYARLLIPHVLPDSVSRALYLDADLLVLDDLGPLWETDLEQAVVGAVLDDLDQRIKAGAAGLEGVPRVRDYFNAGVLLIDLDRWREERISENALEYLVKNPRALFWDQDALNVVCDGRWKKLDSRWNFQDLAGRLGGHEIRLSDMALDRLPRIIHFVSNLKPWHASVLSVNASFYDAYRSRTCFARTIPDKLVDALKGIWSHLKNILRRYALLRVIWTHIRSLAAKISLL